jgi:hypothetical protein
LLAVLLHLLEHLVDDELDQFAGGERVVVGEGRRGQAVQSMLGRQGMRGMVMCALQQLLQLEEKRWSRR